MVVQFLVGKFDSLNSEVLSSQFLHFFLNGLQIGFSDCFHCEIIVKPAVDGRSNGRFGMWVQRHNGLCKQVGSAVFENMDAFI